MSGIEPLHQVRQRAAGAELGQQGQLALRGRNDVSGRTLARRRNRSTRPPGCSASSWTQSTGSSSRPMLSTALAERDVLRSDDRGAQDGDHRRAADLFGNRPVLRRGDQPVAAVQFECRQLQRVEFAVHNAPYSGALFIVCSVLTACVLTFPPAIVGRPVRRRVTAAGLVVPTPPGSRHAWPKVADQTLPIRTSGVWRGEKIPFGMLVEKLQHRRNLRIGRFIWPQLTRAAVTERNGLVNTAAISNPTDRSESDTRWPRSALSTAVAAAAIVSSVFSY